MRKEAGTTWSRPTTPCKATSTSTSEAAGIAEDRRGPLLRPYPTGRNERLLAEPVTRATALKMIERRAALAGLSREICAHRFRGTGITEYLRNGREFEVVARIAGNESTRTTQFHNRLPEEISLDEIDRIHIWLYKSADGTRCQHAPGLGS